MARISIDNGSHFHEIKTMEEMEELFAELRCRDAQQRGALYDSTTGWGTIWCNIVNLMDDETREKAHELVADHCWSEAEFLLKYLELASEPLIIG